MKQLLLLLAACAIFTSCNSTGSNSSGKDQTQEQSADWEITLKVKNAIVTDSELSASSRLVSVTTNNGTVTLSGAVSSKDDMNRIVKITKNVDGVKKVDNQMTVSSS